MDVTGRFDIFPIDFLKFSETIGMNLPAASYGVSKWMMAYFTPSPYPLPKEMVLR